LRCIVACQQLFGFYGGPLDLDQDMVANSRCCFS